MNLPTGGLRHAFTQVLHAENGKAVAVNFSAAKQKSLSWPKRINSGLAALRGRRGIRNGTGDETEAVGLSRALWSAVSSHRFRQATCRRRVM